MTALLLLVLLADGTGATKPPEGYPAFLPFVAGGVKDAKLSHDKTTVLAYTELDTAVAKKLRAMLAKGGFTLEEDAIPGMSGQRFVAKKGESSAYFTIKPGYGANKGAQMIVTDTSGAK